MPQGKLIPVLFSTASSDKVLEERVLAAGGNGLLRKPLGMSELDRAIKAYVTG
jgi:CheY-like chemotaxis protein